MIPKDLPNPKVLAIGLSEDVLGKVRDIITILGERKEEFKNVEVITERRIDNSVALILCKVGPPENDPLYQLITQLREKRIPIIAVLEKYTAEIIDRIFGYGYPALQGIFLKGTEDPEEIGNLARIIKETVRQYLSRQGISLTKRVTWKIQASFADSERRPLVSLFVDTPMREFMQRLTYVLRILPEAQLPSPLDANELRQIFHHITEARRGSRQYSNIEERARQKLCDGPRKNFRGPALWFQPILLEGETGVGKSVIARWCHHYLARRLKPDSPEKVPFQHISILNVGPSILEGELFGVIPGTFTDALPKVGRLHLAMGGVAFLDEIGDLPPEVQVKLLTYLDTMEFEPSGWDYSWKIFCPTYVIAATNRDLRAAIQQGTFRRDLYYRFRHRLRVPPLRERRGDLRAHIDLLLQDPMINPNGAIQEISLAALTRLEGYDYPGNFRELESVLSRAVFRACQDGRKVILPEDIEFPG